MKRRAFTFVELLISIGIVTLIAGGVIIAMTRGASNVHRGSFNVVSANQSAWIVSIMRNDIARSDAARVVFSPDAGSKWKGTSDFSIMTNEGTRVSYSVETRGSGKVFVRSESGGRRQQFAAESLAEMTVELIDNYFDINILMKDSARVAVDSNWTARIYLPAINGADKFWKPLAEL